MSGLHFTDEAERLAHKAWQTLRLEPPVDLSLVAGRLGIVVEEREFVREVDGFYLRLPGVPPAIALNKSYVKPPARRRFTLAHEIGHHLLSHRIPGTKLFFFDLQDTRQTLMERSCDRFAVLLLMPEDRVRQHYEELSHNPGQRLAILSERFGVSTWAMRRRLSELRLPLSRRR